MYVCDVMICLCLCVYLLKQFAYFPNKLTKIYQQCGLSKLFVYVDVFVCDVLIWYIYIHKNIRVCVCIYIYQPCKLKRGECKVHLEFACACKIVVNKCGYITISLYQRWNEGLAFQIVWTRESERGYVVCKWGDRVRNGDLTFYILYEKLQDCENQNLNFLGYVFYKDKGREE